MGDSTVGSRQLVNLLIVGAGTGDSAVSGLQVRLDTLCGGPSVPDASVPEVRPWHKYDEEKQGLARIESPLPKPLVTIIVNNRQRQKFFRQERHPTEDVFAWGWLYNLQFDVWGNTPVQVAGIDDQLARAVMQMRGELWDLLRIGLDLDTSEDVAYDEEQNIFRRLSRGTVRIADKVAIPE